MTETAGDERKGGEWPKGLRDSLVGPYLLSVVAVAFAFAIRLLLDSILGDTRIFIFFMPAVVVGALWGGFWPCMLATVLSLVVSAIFIAPRTWTNTAELVIQGAFLIVGVAVAWLGERL